MTLFRLLQNTAGGITRIRPTPTTSIASSKRGPRLITPRHHSSSSSSPSSPPPPKDVVYEDIFLSHLRIPQASSLARNYYCDLVGSRPRAYNDYMDQQSQDRAASTAAATATASTAAEPAAPPAVVEPTSTSTSTPAMESTETPIEDTDRKRRASSASSTSSRPDKKLKNMTRSEFRRTMKQDWKERKAIKDKTGVDPALEDGKDKKGKWKKGSRRPIEEGPRLGKELAEGEEKEERRPKKKVAVLIGYCGTGYKGMQLNPPTKTIEGDLFAAFVAAGAISKANSDDPKKSSLVRCARTDKGVHAAGNVISLKLIIESPTVIEDINAQLVPQIRVWDIIPTTNGFSCYQFCDSRVYEYLVPTYCFLPPHPTSYMSKRVAKVAEEENDLEAWRERYEDSLGFWQKVADEVKAELEKQGFSEEVIQQVLNSKAEDAEEQLQNLVNEVSDIKSSNTSEKRETSVVELEDGGVVELTPMDITPDEPTSSTVEQEQEQETSTSAAAHKYSKALSTARKIQKQIIARSKRSFRIPPARLERIRKAFELYEGNHSFHNFTIQKTFRDASAKRYIKTFKVSDPIIIDDSEWLSLKVHGQSFMMHQIRKMVGMVMLTIRYGCPIERITEAYGRLVVPIPKAPALGLLLDHPLFETYNKKADQCNRSHLSFEAHKEKIQEFKQKNIYDKLFMEEQKMNTFNAFLSFLDNFETPEFEYLTSKGMKSVQEVHLRKNQGQRSKEQPKDEQLTALMESEDEENVDS
ncbi:tRNA pseudouridine synthase 1 [Orbilia oligospora]|uniref:tRNA pseudouridine synthase 1 n=1 Tax=Orbilia oligospora TaxID=2813651 RepID=A0A8H2E002_ORBOL|nr:tRNA pseudouridine synthase 1 [Orbilia oligospora]